MCGFFVGERLRILAVIYEARDMKIAEVVSGLEYDGSKLSLKEEEEDTTLEWCAGMNISW